MPEPIPENVGKFIAQHVRSLRALELLLLMQADSRKVWTADQLSQELRATVPWAEAELRFFEAVALIVRPDPAVAGYCYAPVRKEQADTIAELQAVYRVRPFAITEAIFSSPRDSIQQFADSFRLRKEKPDG